MICGESKLGQIRLLFLLMIEFFRFISVEIFENSTVYQMIVVKVYSSILRCFGREDKMESEVFWRSRLLSRPLFSPRLALVQLVMIEKKREIQP